MRPCTMAKMTRAIRPPSRFVRTSQSPSPSARHVGMPIRPPMFYCGNVGADGSAVGLGPLLEPIAHRLGASRRRIEAHFDDFWRPRHGFPLCTVYGTFLQARTHAAAGFGAPSARRSSQAPARIIGSESSMPMVTYPRSASGMCASGSRTNSSRKRKRP